VNNGESQVSEISETKVEVLKDGQLLVYGTLKVKHSDETEVKKNKTTAFFRCGASHNKSLCDGAPVNSGFKG